MLQPDTNSVLLGNHGVVCFEKTLMDAYYRLEILDQYSRLLLLGKQVGRLNVLNPAQMTELLEVKEKFGLHDDRLACAPEGCASRQDQPFLTSYDVRPASATCSCNGGAVETHAAPGASGASGGVSEAQFEQMVQSITDQIMARAAG